jgi:hypothetical protein
VQSLAELGNQLLAPGDAQMAIAAEPLTPGGQLGQICLLNTLWKVRQGAHHKTAEGVVAALKITKAPVGLQLGSLVEQIAPRSQAWGLGGFNWLS